MARSLKPMKVGTVKLRGGVGEADIYLDRNDKTFFSMVGEARIAADSADECEKQTREALSAVLTLVWNFATRATMPGLNNSTRVHWLWE